MKTLKIVAQVQKSQFDQGLLNKKLFRLEYLFFLATFPTLQVYSEKVLISTIMKMQRKGEKSCQEKKDIPV